MTTFTFNDIQAKTDRRLQLVREDTDKATKGSEEALDKIRKRFFDDILFPKIVVKAIRYRGPFFSLYSQLKMSLSDLNWNCPAFGSGETNKLTWKFELKRLSNSLMIRVWTPPETKLMELGKDA